MTPEQVTADTPFSPEDDTYHAPLDDPYWVETTWWSLNIPERRLGAWIHAGYHAKRNQVTWRVFVVGSERRRPARLAYYKSAPDVDMPDSPDLRDITFPEAGSASRCSPP